MDEALRDSDPVWAAVGINDLYVEALRLTLAGKLTDQEIDKVMGDTLQQYVERGSLVARRATTEWRQAARAIADAELEVLERVFDRDQGVARSKERHPPHLAPEPASEAIETLEAAVSLRGLLDDHLRHLEGSGRGRAARKAWPRIFEDLLAFIRSHRALKGRSRWQADDAQRLTPEEIISWRDEKLRTLSQKTVKDVWLASVKAVLGHALEDRKIGQNAAKDVKVRFSAPALLREKGFTEGEAQTILRACLAYAPPIRENPATQESAHVTAAKR